MFSDVLGFDSSVSSSVSVRVSSSVAYSVCVKSSVTCSIVVDSLVVVVDIEVGVGCGNCDVMVELGIVKIDLEAAEVDIA